MAQFKTLDLTQALGRLKGRTGASQARAPYREAIASLSAADMLELEPDAGESMRKVKLNVTQAAKEVGRQIEYGVTEDGMLLVWLAEKPRRTRRTRRAKAAEG